MPGGCRYPAMRCIISNVVSDCWTKKYARYRVYHHPNENLSPGNRLYTSCLVLWRGLIFVSIDDGSGRLLNPNTGFPLLGYHCVWRSSLYRSGEKRRRRHHDRIYQTDNLVFYRIYLNQAVNYLLVQSTAPMHLWQSTVDKSTHCQLGWISIFSTTGIGSCWITRPGYL